MPISVEQIIQRYEAACSDRKNFEWHWQEVADYVLPTRSFTYRHTPGEKRRNQIFDDTAPFANEMWAASWHGLLTNPAIRWMNLTLEDFDDARDEKAAEWLYDATSRMLAYFHSPLSGFPTASHELYLDLGAFGTGVVLAMERAGRMTFQARRLSATFLIENDAGEITDIDRCFTMKARDAAVQFGQERLSDKSRQLLESNSVQDADKPIEILHAVYRRKDSDPSSYSSRKMPWASRYIEIEAKHQISEGGFRENPYLTPRIGKAPEEAYGRGPGMQMLPTIKGVNAMMRDNLIAAEQRVRPPMTVPANTMQGPVSTAPGSINYVRSGTRDIPQPMNLGTDPILGLELIRDARQQILKAYFIDKIELPTADEGRGHPRMTAEEVIQRRQQSLLLASPTVSRAITEWLNPAVGKVFRWMLRTGQFLQMPPSLAGKRIKPVYTSPLAQSQRASEATNVLSALSTVSGLAQVYPDMLEGIDRDATLRGVWAMFNAPPAFLRSTAALAQIRQREAQEQQLAAASEIGQGFAKAGRDAAQALEVAGGSAA